jgi:hypothetical protein
MAEKTGPRAVAVLGGRLNCSAHDRGQNQFAQRHKQSQSFANGLRLCVPLRLCAKRFPSLLDQPFED